MQSGSLPTLVPPLVPSIPLSLSAFPSVRLTLSEGDNTFLAGDLPYNFTLKAGNGNDYVVTGKGNDYVEGNLGHDYLVSTGGHDWFEGGPGNDTIVFGTRRSSWTREDIALLGGGEGNDFLQVIDATDAILFGDTGNDILSSQALSTHLHGGDGNDTFYFTSHALVRGDSGADIFCLVPNQEHGGLVRVNIEDFNPFEGDVLNLGLAGYGDIDRNDLFLSDTGELFITHDYGVDVVEGLGTISLIGLPQALEHGWISFDATSQKG